MEKKKLVITLNLNGSVIERDVVSIDTVVGSMSLLNPDDSIVISCKKVD